jgi:hypothetical protein
MMLALTTKPAAPAPVFQNAAAQLEVAGQFFDRTATTIADTRVDGLFSRHGNVKDLWSSVGQASRRADASLNQLRETSSSQWDTDFSARAALPTEALQGAYISAMNQFGTVALQNTGMSLTKDRAAATKAAALAGVQALADAWHQAAAGFGALAG